VVHCLHRKNPPVCLQRKPETKTANSSCLCRLWLQQALKKAVACQTLDIFSFRCKVMQLTRTQSKPGRHPPKAPKASAHTVGQYVARPPRIRAHTPNRRDCTNPSVNGLYRRSPGPGCPGKMAVLWECCRAGWLPSPNVTEATGTRRAWS